jgi:nucleoid-associated protein YgaU
MDMGGLKTVALSQDIKIPDDNKSKAAGGRRSRETGMSVWSTLDRGTRVLILAAGGALLAGISYVGWQITRPEALSDAPPVASAPAVEPVPARVAETPVAEAPAAEKLPKIDTWRVAADGEAVVSGRAEAGAKVEVLVDSLVVASGETSASGEFALLFTLAPNPEPSLMWLSMTGPGAKAVASEEMVALGPIKGPEIAAVAEVPEPATEAAELAEAAAVEAPPALLLSDDGAVVLQDPDEVPPESRAGVMIDTIAYTPEGEVQIGGRGKAGAALRIYLDNAEKAVLRVAEDESWLVPLPGTAPGIYTLRVDQLDEAGKVTSRFETPFKRETLEALAAVAAVTAEAEPAPVEAEVAEVAEPGPEPGPEAAPEPVAEPEPVPEPALEVAAEPAPPPEPEVETASAEPAKPVAAPETAVEESVAALPEPLTPEPAAPEPATPEPAAPEPAAPKPAAPEPDRKVVADARPRPAVTVTVQPGFTLWGIAQERWGDGVYYVQVFEANKDKIKDPNMIFPGQVFAMPEPAAAPPATP